MARGVELTRRWRREGKFVIMGDADDSYDFTALMPFLEKLREGCDLVMGNRFLGGIKPGAMPQWKESLTIGNPGAFRNWKTAVWLSRLRFPLRAGADSRAGEGVPSAAWICATTGMEFATEMVVKATLLNLKIAEAPTTLSPDGSPAGSLASVGRGATAGEHLQLHAAVQPAALAAFSIPAWRS